jgi:hypothetical protein
MLLDDLEVWDIVDQEDLWVFDKLILSRRLGYVCGPKGVYVPKPGKYIVRPCVNLLGMGRGAKLIYFRDQTEYNMGDGTFWCEVFKGRHLTIDYINGKKVLCVEGIKRSSDDMQRWKIWKKVNERIVLPKIISDLKNKYKYLNVEMIDGKVIEVHFRLNPDFHNHKSDYVIPVYIDEDIKPGRNQEFIFDAENDRLGFYVQKL